MWLGIYIVYNLVNTITAILFTKTTILVTSTVDLFTNTDIRATLGLEYNNNDSSDPVGQHAVDGVGRT